MPPRKFAFVFLPILGITGAFWLSSKMAFRQVKDFAGSTPVEAHGAATVVPKNPPKSLGNTTIVYQIGATSLADFQPRSSSATRKADEYISAHALAHFSADQLRATQESQRISFPLPDGKMVSGTVVRRMTDAGVLRLAGHLDDGGIFTLGLNPRGGLGGRILPKGSDTVYVLQTGSSGETVLLEKQLGDVRCAGMPPASATTGSLENSSPAQSITVPVLNSRPGLDTVIYLDFDGETVDGTDWNGGVDIVAAPSTLSSTQITEVWRRVSEDYRPFNINVTTDRAAYDAALPSYRMRCIISPTEDWFPGAGGVAYVGSWADAGTTDYLSDVPCWVFTQTLATRDVADAAAHEVGHTLGLSHDGLRDPSASIYATPYAEYYDGRGSGTTSWAPIMGVGYYANLTQWSNGNYSETINGVVYIGNNTEDDLAIIADITNHTGYITDEEPASGASIRTLVTAGRTTVDHQGIISQSGEIDRYVFSTDGGLVSLKLVNPLVNSNESDLDASLTLRTADGTLIAASDPLSSLWPSFSATVGAGTFYLDVQGVGEGSVSGTGYSNYGSLGLYRIQGSIPSADTQPPAIYGPAEVVVIKNAPIAYQIEATGSSGFYSVSDESNLLAADSNTGLITGTAVEAGNSSFLVDSATTTGDASRSISLHVVPDTLTEALGSPSLVFTTGGQRPWMVDGSNSHDGIASVRSGRISNNYESSWLETTVTGPGKLTFWWKVSSEENPRSSRSPYDYLQVSVDSATPTKIAGEKTWSQKSYSLSSGTHTIRWTYTKDDFLSTRSDAGWVDQIEYVTVPVVSSDTTLAVNLGDSISYQIEGSDSPTSYAATGLPGFLSIDTATGLITGKATEAGTYPIEISATNTYGTGTSTLTLTVENTHTAAAWLAQRPGIGGLTDDPDGDGLPNLIEYALNTDPVVASRDALPVVQSVVVDGESYLSLEFILPADRADLTYSVELSTNLTNWTEAARYDATGSLINANVVEMQHEVQSDGSTKIVVRDSEPESAVSRKFIRLKVSLP